MTQFLITLYSEPSVMAFELPSIEKENLIILTKRVEKKYPNLRIKLDEVKI